MWGVLAILSVVAGAIPLGVGLLVVLPALAASDYLMYRTIFDDALAGQRCSRLQAFKPVSASNTISAATPSIQYTPQCPRMRPL